MLTVIADDITGAAEIAGIAHRYGLRTILTTTVPSTTEGTDVVVIATDARSYPAAEAAEMTAAIVRQLPDCNLFRKTDSALRGNVQEELAAIIDNSSYDAALYLPANPSKQRTIRDGIYYIGDTPLAETDFRFDPEFPAWSSSLSERFPGLPYADAVCKADVDSAVEQVLCRDGQTGRHTLLAGAADLFCSLIERLYDKQPVAPQPFAGLPSQCSMLVVCGSTQSKALDLGLAVESMPYDVFYGNAAPVTWAAAIADRYRRSFDTDSAGCILTIGDKEVRKGKEAAVYLRQTMAEVCCTLLSAQQPDELIIEGGATAFAILSQTTYDSFTVTDEIAPGVVRLATGSLHITLKPGSYSWGGLYSLSQSL